LGQPKYWVSQKRRGPKMQQLFKAFLIILFHLVFNFGFMVANRLPLQAIATALSLVDEKVCV